MFRVWAKIRVGRETGNTGIILFGLMKVGLLSVTGESMGT